VAEFATACTNPITTDATLSESRRSGQSIAADTTELTLTEWVLPGVGSERINAIDEVCPGWLLAATNGGQTFVMSADDGQWVARGNLERSGTIDNIRARGIDSGGPSYGIRDLLVSGENTYYSVGVVDEEASCLRMEVRRVATEDLWVAGVDQPGSQVIYESDPCVDFTEEHREKAPLKIHLGGALAIDPLTDTVYLTIGDYHMGASRISQAVAAGIEATERDYALLIDPQTAGAAVVAISLTTGDSDGEIFSKGLRNALGLVVDGEGRLWASEMGPGGGDELNIITRGGDYGWPLTSPGEPYDRSQWPSSRDDLPAPFLDFTNRDIPGTTPPVRVWAPAIAPSSLVHIPSDATDMAEFAGLLALATLRDQAVHLIDPQLADAPTVARISVGARLRNMVASQSGALFAVTDEDTLIRLSSR